MNCRAFLMRSLSNVLSFPVNRTWSPCVESVFLICSSARRGRDIERENLEAKKKGNLNRKKGRRRTKEGIMEGMKERKKGWISYTKKEFCLEFVTLVWYISLFSELAQCSVHKVLCKCSLVSFKNQYVG
jgi:hypothetical protein